MDADGPGRQYFSHRWTDVRTLSVEAWYKYVPFPAIYLKYASLLYIYNQYIIILFSWCRWWFMLGVGFFQIGGKMKGEFAFFKCGNLEKVQ